MPSGVYKRTKYHRNKISFSLKGHPTSNKTRSRIGKAISKWGKAQHKDYYNAVHRWVLKRKGKAVSCADCLVSGKKKYEWSNVDHKYRKVLKDYVSRCTSCHRKYDLLLKI